jgi:MinD-like ATPase involved in chromosome partitioning or flagellar assembly
MPGGIEQLRREFAAKIGAGTALINAVQPERRRADVNLLSERLETRMAQVMRVPWDRHLAAGGVVDWRLLSSHTREAYLDLAAAVVGTLPDDPAAHAYAAAGRASAEVPQAVESGEHLSWLPAGQGVPSG